MLHRPECLVLLFNVAVIWEIWLKRASFLLQWFDGRCEVDLGLEEFLARDFVHVLRGVAVSVDALVGARVVTSRSMRSSIVMVVLQTHDLILAMFVTSVGGQVVIVFVFIKVWNVPVMFLFLAFLASNGLSCSGSRSFWLVVRVVGVSVSNVHLLRVNWDKRRVSDSVQLRVWKYRRLRQHLAILLLQLLRRVVFIDEHVFLARPLYFLWIVFPEQQSKALRIKKARWIIT